MIGKHLWEKPGAWRAGHERKCLKCGALVALVRVPRFRSRIFRTTKAGKATVGGMSECKP